MIPLPSNEVRRIAEELECVDERVPAIRNLESPSDLVALAYCYNWDDGMAVPRAIAEHPRCDLGTALHLFHLAEGILWMTTSDNDWEYQREWAAFCQDLTTRIEGGLYPTGEVAFEPDLTKVQVLKAQRAGVPDRFLSAVYPE